MPKHEAKARSERPRLLLMPGLDGSGELFAPLLPLLEPHLETRVIRYPDLPDLDAYVEHVRQQLPADGPVSLLAESFSGPVALALMASEPMRIESAVLSASFARGPRPLLSRIAGRLPDGLMGMTPLYRLGVGLFAVHGGEYAEARQLSLKLSKTLDRAALKHRAALLGKVDVSALLERIRVPILCLRALRDRVVPARYADLLVDALPDARCVDIDAPHLLLQTRPQACAGEILRHLQQVISRNPESVQAAEHPAQ